MYLIGPAERSSAIFFRQKLLEAMLDRADEEICPTWFVADVPGAMRSDDHAITGALLTPAVPKTRR
jgi:hypothetical protein